MSLSLLPGSEHGVGHEFFICEDAAFVTAVCPRIVFLYSVTLFLPTSSNTAYSLSGIGRFDKILPCPHEDEQDQCFSSASIKFLMWNIYKNNSYLNCWWRWKWSVIIAINFQFKQSFLSNFCGLDKSTIPPVYLQLSTTLYGLSWAAVHNTFPVRVLASFIHLPLVTLSDNDSKQIAAATSFRMSALLTLRTFLVKVKKI